MDLGATVVVVVMKEDPVEGNKTMLGPDDRTGREGRNRVDTDDLRPKGLFS